MQRSSAILVVPLAAALLACGYRNHHDEHMDEGTGGSAGSGPAQPGSVAQSSIDTGATMDGIDPGQGVGAFVEYSGDGAWHLYLACDTALSKYRCDWDVLVTPLEGALEYAAPFELEDNDFVEQVDSSLNLIATNTLDFDGFDFATSPGAGVRVDVYLDGAPAGRYVYWVGDGGLHRGAPTNPIDLIPSTP